MPVQSIDRPWSRDRIRSLSRSRSMAHDAGPLKISRRPRAMDVLSSVSHPMPTQKTMFPLFLATALLLLPAAAAEKKKDKAAGETGEITGTPVLWQEPTDITSRNLLYGPGGKEHQPPATVTFVEE